jgi:phosphoribosylanthranilate isomerase
MIVRVKICCIGSPGEATMAIDHGANALGLVAKMPSGPGVISNEMIMTIAASIPPAISTFLLTSETSEIQIIEHHRRTFTNTIQVVDKLKEGSYRSLKRALPAVKIVQVIHVMDERTIEEALRISEQVDALLLDSGNPALEIKELGGTGRVHNWKISRKIVEQSKVPVFLAGGLHAGNVCKAIEEVEPFGVDLCSGVRTGSKLDQGKLEAFMKAIFSLQH